ncbi:hypothetical protein ACFC4C_15950 [Streptomyces sp. NPDC056039]|uniref:hypothetical protein n=1 Tax=Streptomyces sp. NPDC056039 TaxID=3345687 RepID=UPI0035D62D1A
MALPQDRWGAVLSEARHRVVSAQARQGAVLASARGWVSLPADRHYTVPPQAWLGAVPA